MSKILYSITIFCLIISIYKDKRKTKKALKKAWKSFENILPEFVGVILLLGIVFSFFNHNEIAKFIGNESGGLGVLISVFIGSITLIPGFLAFPIASLLLDNGAGIMQIAGFVSSLMMVGIVTIPVEIKYFGKKLTIARNFCGLIFSIIVAVFLGIIL